MKIKPKKILAGLLATTMSLSSVFTSFAVTDGSSQGNNGAGVVTGAGGDFSANIENGGTGAKSGKIGIRLSLVDAKDPTNVISVDNEGNKRVVDILYVNQDTFEYQAYGVQHDSGVSGKYHSELYPQFMFTSVKTQPLMNMRDNKNQQVIYQIFYDELNKMFPGESAMPPWLIHTNGKYTSRGEEFVDWCTKDSFGNYAIGADGNLTTTQTTTSVFGTQYKIEIAEKEGTDFVQIKSELTGNVTSGTKEDVYNKRYNGLWKDLTTACDLLSNINTDGGSTKENWRAAIQAYVSAREIYSASLSDGNEQYRKSQGEFTGDFSEPLSQVGEQYNKASILNPFSGVSNITLNDDGTIDIPGITTGNSRYFGPEDIRTILGKAANDAMTTAEGLEVTAGQAPGQENSNANNNTNAGAVDATDEERLKSHIQQILDRKDDSGEGYIFQTPSMLDARNNGNKTSSELISSSKDGNTTTEEYKVYDRTTLQGCDEDWILLVEPIVWLTIFPEGSDKSWIHTKLYGTITNIVQAFNELDGLKAYAGKRTFNYKALNYPVWWALTVTDKAHATGFENPTGGFVFDRSKDGTPTYGFRPAVKIGQERTFAELYESLTSPKPATLSYKYKDEEDNNTLKERTAEMSTIEGWGVNAYWGKEFDKTQMSSTITYNRETTASQKFPTKIAKWYVYQQRDSNGNVVSETTLNVKTGTISTPVKIENEPTSDGSSIWLVTKWGTGTDPNAVPSEGDTRSTFEDYYKKSPGSYGGTKPAVLDLTNDPQEKVLYEKLVITNLVPPTPDDGVTIIKVKEPSNGGNAYIEKEITNQNPYDASETDWDYKEDIQTPNDPQDVHNWSEVPKDGTPGTNPTIPISDTTKTVYIRYTQKPEQTLQDSSQIVLYSNELSYPYTLKDLSKSGKLGALQEWFTGEYYRRHRDPCDGHYYECSKEDCSGHIRYCSYAYNYLTDNHYRLAVTSSNQHGEFISEYTEKDGSWTLDGYGRIKAFFSNPLYPNASYLLYRNKSKDLVTMYPNKNSGDIKTDLAKLGINIESFTPAAHRIGTTGNGYFNDTFTTNLQERAEPVLAPLLEKGAKSAGRRSSLTAMEMATIRNGGRQAGNEVNRFISSHQYDGGLMLM